MLELEERVRSGNFIFKMSETSKVYLERLQSYQNDHTFRNLNANKISID